MSQTQNGVVAITYGAFVNPAGTQVQEVVVSATGTATGNTTPVTQNVTVGTTPVTFNNLPPDTYTFSAQAIDTAGNPVGPPAVASFVITTASSGGVTVQIPTALSVSQP